MTVLQIGRFGGLAPIYKPRKLPEGKAVAATDCRFEAGSIVPLRLSARRSDPVSSQLAFYSTVASAQYKYRDASGAETWLYWPVPWAVDVAPSPIPQDPHGRIYWTRYDPANPNGDNYPRIGAQPTQAEVLGDSGNVRRLGVPAPPVNTAPTLTELQAEASIQPLTMSQTSPVHVVTAEDHPFKEGDRVVVRNPNPDASEDATASNMSELNGLEFVVGNVKAREFDLRNSDGSDYTAFENNTSAIIEKVYGDSDMVSRTYVYTFVTSLGEEGPPSEPSEVTDFRYDSEVQVDISTSIPSGYRGIARLNLYRSATGTGGEAQFYYVGTIDVSNGVLQGLTFVDDIDENALGELLPSAEWYPPPSGLQGLRLLPNGIMVGFLGNTLYFSEPYMPHAWPDSYRRTTNHEIVAIETFGRSLFVGTKGKPYVAYAVDPASTTLEEVDIDAPCLSRRAVAAIGAGVAYASHDGLALVGAGTPQIVTLGLFNKEQWAAVYSSTMEAVFHDRRFIMFTRDGTRPSWMIELHSDGAGADFSYITPRGRAPFVDPDTDQLYIVAPLIPGFGEYHYPFQFEGSSTAYSLDWKSKLFTLPRPVNFGCGQLFADAYPVTLEVSYAVPTAATAIGPASATGQTPTTTNTTMSVTVYGPDPFRLPPAALAREWQFRIVSPAAVLGLDIAESMDELRQL